MYGHHKSLLRFQVMSIGVGRVSKENFMSKDKPRHYDSPLGSRMAEGVLRAIGLDTTSQMADEVLHLPDPWEMKDWGFTQRSQDLRAGILDRVHASTTEEEAREALMELADEVEGQERIFSGS